MGVLHCTNIDVFSALVSNSSGPDLNALLLKIARNYKECMNDMCGRSPGKTLFALCS